MFCVNCGASDNDIYSFNSKIDDRIIYYCDVCGFHFQYSEPTKYDIYWSWFKEDEENFLLVRPPYLSGVELVVDELHKRIMKFNQPDSKKDYIEAISDYKIDENWVRQNMVMLLIGTIEDFKQCMEFTIRNFSDFVNLSEPNENNIIFNIVDESVLWQDIK